MICLTGRISGVSRSLCWPTFLEVETEMLTKIKMKMRMVGKELWNIFRNRWYTHGLVTFSSTVLLCKFLVLVFQNSSSSLRQWPNTTAASHWLLQWGKDSFHHYTLWLWIGVGQVLPKLAVKRVTPDWALVRHCVISSSVIHTQLREDGWPQLLTILGYVGKEKNVRLKCFSWMMYLGLPTKRSPIWRNPLLWNF